MKRLFTVLAMTALAVAPISAQTSDFFTPYQSVDMRLPSVPLIVNDPYLSVWSPYDRLTDGATRHWTHAKKNIDGLLRVDGKVYRFMGEGRQFILESILPMADEGAWEGKTVRSNPADGWYETDFDDSAWGTEKGAFGTPNEYPNVNTSWTAENSDVYVRRTVNLTADDLNEDLYIVYSHDDVFELYLNGTKIVDTGNTWVQGVTLQLSAEQKSLLKEGDNVIAVHCHNTVGGALLDYGLYRNIMDGKADVTIATQKSVDVLATNTYYTFECGPVELDVVFTAPMLIDDLDLLSTPINYISYQVRSTDAAEHNVQFYLATTAEQAVNQNTQTCRSRRTTVSDVAYVYAGTTEQPVLKKSGDGICIDWGYFYMSGMNGTVALGKNTSAEKEFAETGAVTNAAAFIVSRNESQMPYLTFVHDFGNVTTGSSFAMMGYDEVYDIQYMGTNYKGYWARDGKTIFTAFQEMGENYESIMTRCRELDKKIYDDGLAAGNKNYAEILSASYRHVIAAHKLFQDKDGNLLFFSKENNSNGCVNTVDLTYPSAPLFLLYNPELMKGMMTSIFDYSYSGRWTKPFAAHDLGTYPLANGQVYGGDMPLEESGNMLTLAATICRLEGSTAYVDKYWDIIKTWTDYLVEYGQDPENQLCTDDFAGHWAHNCNLSIKAIMGIVGFSEMARIKGDTETADTYLQKAKDMARIWESMAREGDHYRLAYDRANTWSQKYNMVWDKLWGTKVFPGNPMEVEIKYYLTKQNKYGLPLDSRMDYTKSDWIMWTAAMASNNDDFLAFSDRVYKYMNETGSRVPTSDWYYTSSGNMVGFKARSVIGGHWMKVLMDKMAVPAPETGWAPAGSGMKTRWAAEVSPENVLPEYPRPTMSRNDWLNLNGLWQYGFTTAASTKEPAVYEGNILVPFPLESSLSGVMQKLGTSNALWYKRTFTIPEEWSGKSIILNFGASDYRTYVYVNGRIVSSHTGGYCAFSKNITNYLNAEGENTLLVRVVDPNSGEQPIGKQRIEDQANGSIWYTSVSGIWQTVWIEPVNSSYISSIKTTPDLDNSKFLVNVSVANASATATVNVVLKDQDDIVAQVSAPAGTALELPVAEPKLWSPEHPNLYDMYVTLTDNNETLDDVTSYAAMRKISVKQDKDGIYRLQLNNEDLFQLGVLDQGYWPDGIYTAPTDEALQYDIITAKKLGFNMIRKHAKTEPARWYYYCDLYGMLVWQDMPSLAVATETWTPSTWYTETEGSLTPTLQNNFQNEWANIISQCYNNPSVVVWTPFNEAWGQFRTSVNVEFTYAQDNTRLVNPASGGNHYKVGDMLDLHDYNSTPSVFFYDETRPTVLGEFGGLSYNVAGHRWNPDYIRTAYSSDEGFTNGYTTIIDKVSTLAKPVEGKAFSAAVYTQLTDVETEMNGLMTYDRDYIKVDMDRVKAANDALSSVLSSSTGIDSIHRNDGMAVPVTRYNVAGQQISTPERGVNIVRYSDGTTRKIVVR